MCGPTSPAAPANNQPNPDPNSQESHLSSWQEADHRRRRKTSCAQPKLLARDTSAKQMVVLNHVLLGGSAAID